VKNIAITTADAPDRSFPSFASDDNGQIFLIYRTFVGKDATLWALNMNADGERVKYDDAAHVLIPVGAAIHITV